MPIDPCGMVMDVVRTAYERDCKFFRANDTVIPVRWYRAPETAKFFPVAHKINSLAWYSSPWDAEGVGEVYAAISKWKSGFTPPTALGQDFCGPLEYFRQGCEFNPFNDTPRDQWGVAIECGAGDPNVLLQADLDHTLVLQADGSWIELV